MSFEVLERVYDAAISPGRWRTALDAIAEACGADAAGLVIRSSDSEIRDKTMLSTVLLNFSRSPSGIYYGLVLDRHQKGDWDIVKSQEIHKPKTDVALVSTASELDSRSDYRFLNRKLGLRRRLAVRLNREPVWFDAMSLAFNSTYEQVPGHATSNLVPLLPHITKAVEIGRMFGELKARQQSALEALDRIKIGIAVVDRSGVVMMKNSEAERIFSEHGGLRVNNKSELVCANERQTSEIRSEIWSLSESARTGGSKCEHTLVVAESDDKQPLLVELAPMSSNNIQLTGASQGVLVTIVDPARVPTVKLNRFSKLYGMTAAEAEVCGFVIQGLSIAEISENRSTTPVTTKNQVASILGKTETKSRMELIQLLMRVLPPIE